MSNVSGTLSFGPFEPGYGQTVGHALRRVLLSSISGLGLVGVKIVGVSNRFSPIDGINIDVEDVLLNLKKIVFKSTLEEFTMRLNVNELGDVTASMIDDIPAVEILNPEQYICTLSKNVSLSLELIVKLGKGYVAYSDVDVPEGYIALDVVFSPVTRVVWDSIDTRVGQKTNYNKLEITVDTNGSIEAKDALSQASKILISSLQTFNTDEPAKSEEIQEEAAYVDQRYLDLLSSLTLSTRAKGAIEFLKLVYVGDLVTMTEDDWRGTPQCGKKTLEEIKNVLETNYGFSLGTEIENWSEVRPKNMEL